MTGKEIIILYLTRFSKSLGKASNKQIGNTYQQFIKEAMQNMNHHRKNIPLLMIK